MATINKCPYCYRPLGTWKHDPILLPDGSKYKWSDDTHLILVPNIEDRIYKGTYQITRDEFIELQDHRKAMEEELLPVEQRTKFSPINTTGEFQININHIKELRESTEKLLISMGITKSDYFNYDEDSNYIINPNGDKSEWFEPSLEADKFQCKNLHIEDLRHNIPTWWFENWNKGLDFSGSCSDSKSFIYPPDWDSNYGLDKSIPNANMLEGIHKWDKSSGGGGIVIMWHVWGYSGEGISVQYNVNVNKTNFINHQSSAEVHGTMSWQTWRADVYPQFGYEIQDYINLPQKFKIKISDISDSLTKNVILTPVWGTPPAIHWLYFKLNLGMRIWVDVKYSPYGTPIFSQWYDIHYATYKTGGSQTYQPFDPTIVQDTEINNIIGGIFQTGIIDIGYAGTRYVTIRIQAGCWIESSSGAYFNTYDYTEQYNANFDRIEIIKIP
jgi:hypothetical protein